MHPLVAVLFAAAIAAQPSAIRCDRAIPPRVWAQFSRSGVALTWTDGVALLDPQDGATRWQRKLSPDSRIGRPIVLLDDRVILADGNSIVAYSIDNGRELWRKKHGRVSQFSATPHLLARVTADHRSKLLRLDPATGNVLAGRIARASESMSEVSGVILDVQLPNESDGAAYVIIGYDPGDLKELWRFRGTGSASFVLYDGVPYFASMTSLFPIDLETGTRGPVLSATGPVDTIWGGSTRQLESIDDVDGRSRLRRNDVVTGKALWTADVPFEVFNTLRDGDLLYVTGGVGMENDPHYVATIDWRDGTVRKISGPIPFVFQWDLIDGAIVATTWDNRFLNFSP